MSNMPAWWGEKQDKQRQNRRSARQERQVARSVGGKVQPGSGSSPRARGDVKSSEELIEVKYTDRDSFSIRKAVWTEHVRRARVQGREPVMVIKFDEHTTIRITEA